MKVHYVNILLFALPLNILEHNQRNHYITTYTHINRSLCECELYAPANYDNDPQMKEIMENFDRQASQRLRDYEDRMVEKRKQCKDKCDKEIQKIILKDKLEKELMDKFATLQTDIQSDAIPTCVCEKSMADNVEKDCLKCAYGLGTVAPTVGLIGAVEIGAWKNAAIIAAKEAAEKAGIAAGKAAHDAELLAKFTEGLEALNIDKLVIGNLESLFSTTPFTESSNVPILIYDNYRVICGWKKSLGVSTCDEIGTKLGVIPTPGEVGLLPKAAIAQKLNGVVAGAEQAANAKAAVTEAAKKAAIEAAQGKAIEATSTQLYPGIGYSILAILIIILVMVIIYLILRYRRKKKMKKKMQYIKLLEE
ncbi:rifin [Plasmodium reichenowi]|uniref:Rifin n=1 Tax=Plasmodium reichenowi TaxID=5854 RepID=A0A060RLV3_PLARE|nr:rifin [Plasmodium reichenowi]